MGVTSLIEDDGAGIFIIAERAFDVNDIVVITISPEEIDPTIPDCEANWLWYEDHSSCEVEFLKDGK